MFFLRALGRFVVSGGYALCVLIISCERKQEEGPDAQNLSASSPKPKKTEILAPTPKCPDTSTSRSEIALHEPWAEPGVERAEGQAVPPGRPPPTSKLDRQATMRSVKLFFPFADDRFADCLAHGWVEREVPACELPLDYAIKSVLSGLKSQAPALGLTDPMQQSTKGEDIAPLIGFYQGLQINREGIVLLAFSEPALAYLNQAACAADAVRSSLSRTAQQFEGILGVAFVIDGKPFADWDG